MKNRVLINLFFFSLLIFITSCSEDNKFIDEYFGENTKIIYLSNNFEKNIDHLHSVFDYISFLKLETKEECLISDINQLSIIDSLIYINDNDKRLLVFGQDGSFKYQIGSRGGGPGEYREMRGFCFNKNNEIEILDFRQIHLYTLKGEYLYSKRFDLLGEAVYCNATHFVHAPIGGYYLWGGTLGIRDFNSKPTRYLMYHVNDQMEVQAGFFPIKHGAGSNFFKFTLYKDTLLIDPSYANFNIYQIDKQGNISSRYFYDFGDKALKPSTLKKKRISDHERRIEIPENKISEIWSFMENEKWTHLNFAYDQKWFTLIHSKKEERNYILTAGNRFIKNDELRYWGGKFITDNSLIMPIEVDWLQEEIERLDSKYIEKIGLKEIASLPASDNPVLVFYHFKDN